LQSYDRAVARFKKNLVATGVGLVLVPALIYLVVVVTGSVFSGKPFEHVAVAFQRTVAFSKGTYIGGEDIQVTQDLATYAAGRGVDEEKLRAIIAGAMESGIEPSHMLGFAEVETAYCRNIGKGVAIDEVTKRLAVAPPKEIAWWQENATSLNNLAKQLGIDVKSIPGSVGAGAISCFQLMPSNWMKYGGGDYNSVQLSVKYAGLYLKDAGYKKSNPSKAILRYNPNAGQPYVNSVLNAAAVWEPYIKGNVRAYPDTNKGIGSLGKVEILEWPVIFLENLALELTGKLPEYNPTFPEEPVNLTDGLMYPIPGVFPSGYTWMSPVYYAGALVAYHTGQDYIGSADVIASHSGVVTFSRYLSTTEGLAVAWWISGNVVVIRGTTQDGTPICTFYGHGYPNTTRVRVGDAVGAGQFLFRSGNTGFSNATHLHFSIKIGGNGDFCDGGNFVNPNLYVSP